ncbi:hypothetical protein [Geomicrobium sp. JCM 19037]|uniref:hypothetical protein n=1 Tax=Geomicrobium sp. JCM 19037 TaxID=1460634 RepID=UPI00187CB1F9|nr:hypothetical protein [Geomicrobium sp. JCM 19037]
MKLNEVLTQATEISDWLRENQNPYMRIEITDSDVKMASVEEFVPRRAYHNGEETT